MSDAELVKRLRDRAKEERLIQANNEAVATALRGQRLLFDQGHRSPSNTYAVRLALNHEDCARQDAKLAADWDDAADRIEALTAKLAEAEAKLAKAVEALEVIRDRQYYLMGAGITAQVIARATLAEIEGEKG
jgi:hypothetical protein